MAAESFDRNWMRLHFGCCSESGFTEEERKTIEIPSALIDLWSDSPSFIEAAQRVLDKVVEVEARAKADQGVKSDDPDVRKPQPAEEAVYLGQGRVRVGSETISLTGQARAVIEALIDLGAADKPHLERKSACTDAVRILRKVRRKHPTLVPFIIMAGRPNSGGYRTTIRRPTE